METSIAVIGLNHRSAPVAVRERFWVAESRRCETLMELSRYEGIEEVVVLTTCNRTEYIVCASDMSAAANSILNFLSRQHGLRLCDWKNFYRLFDEAAISHIFRVTCGLDSMVLGNPEIMADVQSAWDQARKIGSTDRYLDAIFSKALSVCRRVHAETAIGSSANLLPRAVVEMARRVFPNLSERRILVMGSSRLSELSAECFAHSGARDLRVLKRVPGPSQDVADSRNGTAVLFEHRWDELMHANIVVTATACPHFIISQDDANTISEKRGGAPLCLIDLAIPRDIDPAVREVEGVFLYDIDDLGQAMNQTAGEHQAGLAEAEKIVAEEAKDFRKKLMAEPVVPTIQALRTRLDEIYQQELEAFSHEAGPFPEDQQRAVDELMSRITQRLANAMAREIKSSPETVPQHSMVAALSRLFHLERVKNAVARSQN